MIDPEKLAPAAAVYPLAKLAAESAEALVLDPAREVVAGTMKEFFERKLRPKRRRVLSLEDAAALASAGVQARLVDVAPELLVEPSPAIAAGVVEALQTRADEPKLRAMFADLLANACRGDRADGVHVAFVEIIRQLEPEDAQALRVIAQLAEHISPGVLPVRSATGMLAPTRRVLFRSAGELASLQHEGSRRRGLAVLGNLERLGLVSIKPTGMVRADDPYDIAVAVELTLFGEQFAAVCLPVRRPSGEPEAARGRQGG